MFVVAEKRERLERIYGKWQQRLGSTHHQIVVRYFMMHKQIFFVVVNKYSLLYNTHTPPN